MEAMEMIRLAQPQVAPATVDETAAIRASFERRKVAEPETGLWARIKRLTRRQMVILLAICTVVPASAYAIKELTDNDRSEQIKQATTLVPVNEFQQERDSVLQACLDAKADGVTNDSCRVVIQAARQEGTLGNQDPQSGDPPEP